MRYRTEAPSFAEESMLLARGYVRVAGVDEAGRGPLAGPVVAAAVVLAQGIETPWFSEVRDSKELTASVRDVLYDCIRGAALGVGVGQAESGEIDAVGIAPATRLAMRRAIEQLRPAPDWLLIDYVSVPEVKLPQTAITRGDSLCTSIACASIVAKVIRDRLMKDIDRRYPGYGFVQHKGYGTPEHLLRLQQLGPCPVHRRSFQPVRGMLEV